MFKRFKDYVSKTIKEAGITNAKDEKKKLEGRYKVVLEQNSELSETIKLQIMTNKELSTTNRELKKQLALSNEAISELEDKVTKLKNRNRNLRKKVKEINGK